MKPRISQLDQSGATDGDVITWDDTAGEWVAGAAGAGYTDEQVRDVVGAALVGGSNVTITVNDPGDTITIASSAAGSTLVSIDDPALWTGSNAADYEFDADTTSLPSGWSWLNQGGAAYTEKYGRGGLSVVGNSSYASRGLTRAEPAGSTYTAVFKLHYTLLGVGSTPSANCGIFLRNSSSGKLVQYGRFSSGNIGIETANSPTSYSGNTGLVSTQFDPIATVYMRIVKASATSYSFGTSADGVLWDDTSTAYNPQTFFGAAVTDIGFYLNSTATTRTACISCEWLRVR